MNYNIFNVLRGNRAEPGIPEPPPEAGQDAFYPAQKIIRIRPINRPRSPVAHPTPMPQVPPVQVPEDQQESFQ